MGSKSRMKEEERIEKTIRGLLKLPENRRCINCNSLGPQYVCTTFLTFVCTNCSGVHREFTHRVKSVSMAKFKAEEVSALQAGGNERARQIYLKEWDPQRHSFPDSSNLHKLRDFIKHVYVMRKYAGERSTDKLPRLKMSDKDYDSNSKVDKHERSLSERSSPVGRKDERSFKYYYDERRSPRYARENNRYGGYKRSPVRFEVVDDRVRDDRFVNSRKSNQRTSHSMESMPGSRSPDCQKNISDRSKSPVVRPVSDILGDNAPSLQVGELPKQNEGHNQKIASSSNVKSTDGNVVGKESVSSGSLIDFSANPEPSDAAPMPQAHQVPPSIDTGNRDAFGSSAKEKAFHAPNENTLESLLSQLMVPAGNMNEAISSGSAPSATNVGDLLMLPCGVGSSTTNPPNSMLIPSPNESSLVAASTSNQPTNVITSPPTTNPPSNVPMPHSNEGAPASGTIGMKPVLRTTSCDYSVKVNDGQLPSMHQNQPSASSNVDQQTSPSVGALDDHPWPSSLASNADGLTSGSAEPTSQDVSKQAQDIISSGDELQVVEVKPNGRKELPADLFTATYSAISAPVPGWQTSPHQVLGLGFGIHYHPAAAALPRPPSFINPTKSTNPFDINSGTVPAAMFPSMASLQGALPNVSAPTGLLGTSSSGTQSPQLMSSQSPSYSSAMPTRSPSYASAIPPRPNMEQQAPNNTSPSGIQGLGSFSSDGADFGSFNTNQQPTGRYTGVTSPDSFSSRGGNPFG